MTCDSVVQVKDTASWTLGRISELHPGCIHVETHLPNLVQTLVRGLQDSPRVASNCAWAIMNLSESIGCDDEEAQSYALSVYFEHIVTALLQVTER
jgi:importin subunit beta-1